MHRTTATSSQSKGLHFFEMTSTFNYLQTHVTTPPSLSLETVPIGMLPPLHHNTGVPKCLMMVVMYACMRYVFLTHVWFVVGFIATAAGGCASLSITTFSKQRSSVALICTLDITSKISEYSSLFNLKHCHIPYYWIQPIFVTCGRVPPIGLK